MSTRPRSMVGPGTSMQHLPPARSGHGSPTMDPHAMHQQPPHPSPHQQHNPSPQQHPSSFQQTLQQQHHGQRSGNPSPTIHQSPLSAHGDGGGGGGGALETPTRKPKGPSVRKACVACHTGKTRCSESLPCQACVKRGIAATCAYPDPSNALSTNGGGSNQTSPQQAPPTTLNPAVLSQGGGGVISKEPTFQVTLGPTTTAGSSTAYSTAYGGAQYYTDTHGRFTGASSSSFRPAKRAREEEEDGQEHPSPAPPPPPPQQQQQSGGKMPPPPTPPKGRPLTEGEAAALTHPGGGMPGWTRGDIFVGSSAPIRIDPRLPVKLVLGEGGLVNFIIGDGM
ncbi:hypothetical protein CYLTODRAFT_204978 [Cylindrobasidium torrendii FP15055 ss-10]|uniref:Zn(2)-C6 fungal-type domain-containing protein n=1 Tax=Cylindrobasidium torrendii FP15055 ss-10 TaxID=1314674 RepID=A0A0D7AVB0_9AGAR|nr:hypothetical protein CYLTODRAFT_204978 [Cylindrobasidium torrendii FP15055 ss-10]